MSKIFRAAVVGALTYTALVGYFLWLALFADNPGDSAIFMPFTALPSSILADSFEPSRLPGYLSSLLNLPNTGRFTIQVGAVFFWLVGCVQYSILSALAYVTFSTRRAGA